MLQCGPAIKITIYLNTDTSAAHGFLVDEILAFLRRKDVEGATVLQAHAGFGAHRQLHTSGSGDVNGLHLPTIIYFVESEQKVASILDDLLLMVTDGLVEAHPTEVLKNASSPERVIS